MSSGFSIDSVAKQVDAVLGEDLYWFPVRHHSPAAARFVRSAIETRRPKVVFIEGPADANHLAATPTGTRTGVREEGHRENLSQRRETNLGGNAIRQGVGEFA